MKPTELQTFYETIQASAPTAPDAFVAIDYDFTFLFLNRNAERLYKKTRNELIGKKIETMFPEEWDVTSFKNLRVSVTAKKAVEINYNTTFGNVWVQLVGRPFENYYTFTYRMIDHKDMLRKELHKAVKKNNGKNHPTAK